VTFLLAVRTGDSFLLFRLAANGREYLLVNFLALLDEFLQKLDIHFLPPFYAAAFAVDEFKNRSGYPARCQPAVYSSGIGFADLKGSSKTGMTAKQI
jgi:hypothetical protein